MSVKIISSDVDIIEKINKDFENGKIRSQKYWIDLKGVGESHTLASLGYTKQSIIQAEHIYLLSERGYAKLIKIRSFKIFI